MIFKLRVDAYLAENELHCSSFSSSFESILFSLICTLRLPCFHFRLEALVQQNSLQLDSTGPAYSIRLGSVDFLRMGLENTIMIIQLDRSDCGEFYCSTRRLILVKGKPSENHATSMQTTVNHCENVVLYVTRFSNTNSRVL